MLSAALVLTSSANCLAGVPDACQVIHDASIGTLNVTSGKYKDVCPPTQEHGKNA
jgi:hypothetical protein